MTYKMTENLTFLQSFTNFMTGIHFVLYSSIKIKFKFLTMANFILLTGTIGNIQVNVDNVLYIAEERDQTRLYFGATNISSILVLENIREVMGKIEQAKQ